MQEILTIIKKRECTNIRIDLTKDFPLQFLNETGLTKKQNRIKLQDLIHSDDLPEIVKTFDEVLSKKKDRVYVHTRIMLDDHYVWFLICCDYHKSIKSNYLSGILLNVSNYIESTSDDPVIKSFRKKYSDIQSNVHYGVIPLSEILDTEYLAEIQMPFKVAPGLYSAIYDDHDNLICTPIPETKSFDYKKYKFCKRESIRINHITTAYWIIASDEENKISQASPLLKTLVLTVSRIANAYVTLFKEFQNSNNANKLLSENIEQQMLINSIYNIILEEKQTETSLRSVLRTIGEYMRIDRIFIYEDHPEKEEFNLLYEYIKRKKQVPVPEIIKYKDYSQILKDLEFTDLYHSTSGEHEFSSFGINSFAVANLNADGNRSGIISYQALERESDFTSQELKILHSVSQIIATLLIQIEADYRLKETTEQLRHLAFFDPTLNIPNRAMLDSDLNIEFAKNQHGAIISLKMTNMKLFNELFGHGYTDLMLREVAVFINNSLPENASIYRFSGTMFIILFKNDDGKLAKNTVQYLLKRFKEPWIHEDNEHFLDIIQGIALYPENGKTGNDLFRAASLAMYKAAEFGVNNYAFFNNEFEKKPSIDYYFTQKLRNSIMNNMEGFYLTFQSVIDIRTDLIQSAEVFINWSLGDEWLPTAKIVQIAESIGYDIYLDAWVLEKACCFCKKVQRDVYPEFTISVNITSRELRSGVIVPVIKSSLNSADLNPKYLSIEIHESILTGQSENVAPIIGKLNELGVNLIIDGFGKELSAIGLFRFSYIDLIKVEFSLFSNLFDEFDEIILDTIIRISKTVKNGVCVKRIEDEKQMELLEKYNISLIQGYLFAKPLPEEEFIISLLQKKETCDIMVDGQHIQ